MVEVGRNRPDNGDSGRLPLVFLSYSHEDGSHPLLERLIADLRDEHKVKLWVADQELGPGYSIAFSIDAAIRQAPYMIFVVSKNGGLGKWQTFELQAAYRDQLEKGRAKIIPVRIDDVPLPPALIPLSSADLFVDYHKALRSIVDVITHTDGDTATDFDIGLPANEGTILQVSGLVGQRLIEYFAFHPDEMKSMDRRKFEEFVAELFKAFGYDVELTKCTRDGGKDIIAVRQAEVKVRYLIECKRPDPGGYVGVGPVRELYAVKTDEQATKAILATTAYFSPEAMVLFEKHPWELEPRDYAGIMEWVQAYRTSKGS